MRTGAACYLHYYHVVRTIRTVRTKPIRFEHDDTTFFTHAKNDAFAYNISFVFDFIFRLFHLARTNLGAFQFLVKVQKANSPPSSCKLRFSSSERFTAANRLWPKRDSSKGKSNGRRKSSLIVKYRGQCKNDRLDYLGRCTSACTWFGRAMHQSAEALSKT